VPGFNFSKNYRLSNSSEFQKVFDKNDLKISNANLLILALSSEKKNSRLGLVIGKKNVKTAVGRNKVKRVVRETFRKNAFKPSLDVIVIARRGLANLTADQLNLLLNESWCRLHDRCNKIKDTNG
jgi:ribonuclease P protein component